MVIRTRGGLPVLLEVPPLDLLGLAFFRINLSKEHEIFLREQGASVITDLNLLEAEDYKAGQIGVVTRRKLLLLAEEAKGKEGKGEEVFA